MDYEYNLGWWPLLVVALVALIFFVLALTWIKKYISPETPTDRKDFVQVVVVGLGAIVGIGTFLVAWSTLQQSQLTAQQSQATAQENLVSQQKVAAQNTETSFVQSYLDRMSASIAD